MLRVGLTGSIAVGKSFVSRALAELGCRVVDADALAREVVEPGTEGLAAVVEAFGAGVLTPEGRLDRARLGSIVFADAGKRLLLNSILHPRIWAAQDGLLRAFEAEEPDGIAVVDAALMIESGGYKRFDKLVVVHCRPEIQRRRLIERDGLSDEEADRRIGSQMAQEEKLRYADYAIDTSGGFEDTLARTRAVHAQLRELAANREGD